MGFAVQLCLGMILSATISWGSVDGNYDKYVSLVSDIRNGFGASSVFFAFSQNKSLFKVYTTAHVLSRHFSDQAFFTLITHFDTLTDRLDYYRKRIGRPLIVILLQSLSDIEEFSNSIRYRRKSFSVWLVIFNGITDESVCEFCHRPPGNTFGLRFDTTMMILCCEDSMLKEWWSVDGNRTEIGDYGIWTGNGPFKLIVFPGRSARRHDFLGRPLRIAIVTNSPLVHDHGDRIGGFFGIVLAELQRVLNFTIPAVFRAEVVGGYNSTAQSWSGAMGFLAREEADLAIADFTMTDFRLDYIEFTSPLLLTRTKLFIKEPDNMGVHWFAYFKAFASDLWMILIVLIITTPLLLALIKIKKDTRLLCSLYFDNYLCVWGIYCQQGLFEFPTEAPMRIAYFSIFVSALVVYVAYSASLISFLTVNSSRLPFTDLLGFVQDKSYKLIVYQNSSDYDFIHSSTDPIYAGMMKLMKPLTDLPSNPNQAWKQVCEQRVALFATEVEKKTMNITCNIVGIDTGRVDSLAIGLPPDSEYSDVVNYLIQRFKSNGMFTRLRARYYNDETPTEKTYDVVEFSRIAPILSVLAGGIILAFIVWTCETIYSSRRDRGRRRSHGIELPILQMRDLVRTRGRRRLSSRHSRPPASLGIGKFDTTFIGYYP